MCCYLLNVKWLNKKPLQECIHCEKKVGCKIHETKPSECTDFDCAYVQMDKVSPALRPDKCNIIFEKITDDIFVGLCENIHIVTPIAFEQIAAFKEQGFSVVVVDVIGSKPRISVGEGKDGNVVYKTFMTKYRERNGSG